MRVLVTAAWFVSGAALLRYWDLTIRFEGFLVWTTVFVCSFSLATIVLRKSDLQTAKDPWLDVSLWAAIVVLASIIQLVFPQLVLGDSTVQTVALLRVLDIVLPLWILHRGVSAVGSGRLGVAVTLSLPLFLLACLWLISVRMPGQSHVGARPPLSVIELDIRDNSRRHVEVLADSIGSRGSRRSDSVGETRAYLRETLVGLGYEVEESSYQVGENLHWNLQVSILGRSMPSELVIVGAHYDTYDLTPGADDNATGVAGVLELARLLSGQHPTRTIRFVFFGTEEPPYFNTNDMGSRVYAMRAREAGEQIVAMYSLEMLGYYSDAPGSQHHPPPLGLFFPHRGDFIAFVGNPPSGRLLRRSLEKFRDTTPFPSEGIVSSSMVPGVELSDHASFWRQGYPAVLISDTGPFRNTNYHLASDVSAGLDFNRMARVVGGVYRVLEEIAGI